MRRSNLALLILLLAGPVLEAAPPQFAADAKWVPIFTGVELAQLSAEQPRALKGHAVRIELKADGILFLATPGNGDKPGETDGQTTSQFFKAHKLQLAINAAPYGPVEQKAGSPRDVVGAHVSSGKLVSEAFGKYPALAITKENQARILEPPFDFTGVENAVGGFQIVLKNGKVQEGSKDLHPRTAAGISADGKYLIWLVVDGRQITSSLGGTTSEVGEWLSRLGANDGINLDGGGTTTLVTADEKGEPKVVNRPVHGGIPGQERVAGSHLGLYAKPLK
jgi:hypothetical protein